VQGASASADDLSFAGASNTTGAGTAAVEITALPTAATLIGEAMVWPAPGGVTLSVRRGGTSVSYELQAGDTVADAVAGLQASIDSAGLEIVVSDDGSALTLTAAEVGSARSFDAAWDGVTWYAALGTDIAGTIDGKAATGQGRTLTASATDSPYEGLAITYGGAALGPVGTVTYEPGLAQRLVSSVATARKPQGGALTSSTNLRESRMELLTRSIEAYDRRLVTREAQIRAQYAALEVALGKLQSTGTWLSGQLGALMSGSSS
jgi:flagellar hook-associated protein 2